jgi:hypothetical protein
VQTISDLLEQLAASLLASLTLLQEDDDNLFQTCQQLGAGSANTSCRQAVRSIRVYTCTAYRQVVFALLVPSCCNKFVTNCEQLVTSLMALSDLLQGCSNKSDTVMI